MANIQVKDAYGSVITIQSSTFGSAERQIVGASIIGRVPVDFLGSQAVSVQGTVFASILGRPSISGQVGASVIGTVPITQSGKVITSISGIPQIEVIGSVAAIRSGTWLVSDATQVNEDQAHSAPQTGKFILGLRNDAVASIVSANDDYIPFSMDSAGRTLIKPFAAEEARIEGYTSIVSTSVTTLVAAAGAGLRNYITDVWVANTGATTTLVTFKDGAGSILGYTIAPATGGSNLPGLQTPIRTGANATFDIQPATATSVLYATVKGYKAP